MEMPSAISHHAVTSVPGFGDATASKLTAWRKKCELNFVYNPTTSSDDAQAKAKIEAEFSSKARALANKLIGGKQEFIQLARTAQSRLMTPVPELVTLYTNRLQAEADLEFLGISKPYKHKSTATTNAPAYKPATRPTTPSPALHGNPTCPQCGSTMVRRIAKRGRNRGGSFWGCSRFPRCRGTRP